MSTTNLPLTEQDAATIHAKANLLREEIRKIIVGQDAAIDLMLSAILANGHVLLEGAPGVAKTLTAKLLARCIQSGFSRIQFTPDLMPSDITGTNVFNFKSSEFEFKKGPIFSNIILIDEINRAPAKTQAALFEVMEERQITIDGTTYPMLTPFIVFATQNPIEHEGTYRLPEAQLDRFMYKIEIHYPDVSEEEQILSEFQARGGENRLDVIQPVMSGGELSAFQQMVRQVYVEPNLIRFIAQITDHTRQSADLYVGASTRASIAMLTAAKALAAIRGRHFVTPDDIATVARPVLRHRILLTPEKEMEGISTNTVIGNILQIVEVPR